MKNIICLLYGTFILFYNCSGDRANEYFKRGNEKINNGNFREAIVDYNKAIEINSNSAEAYINRGNAKSSLQDYIDAIADYNEALRINPNLVSALSNRGRCKLELKDYIGALNDCTKALSIKQDGFSFAVRGAVRYCLKDYKAALSDLNSALEYYYENGLVYYNRGLVKNSLNDDDGACSDWSKAGEMGVKQAYEQIAHYCNQGRKSSIVHFECSNCNEIKFRNPTYGFYDNETSVLTSISVVNNTEHALMDINVRYRCLDSNGNETDSGYYLFGGRTRVYVEPNSVKKEECHINFPNGGKIVFEFKSYIIWPCPDDKPC